MEGSKCAAAQVKRHGAMHKVTAVLADEGASGNALPSKMRQVLRPALTGMMSAASHGIVL